MITHRMLAQRAYTRHPDLLWCFPEEQRRIYLTFDDGPLSPLTQTILEILGEAQVSATFFVSGESLEKCTRLPDYRGHTVGSHLYSHVRRPGFFAGALRTELQRSCDLIEQRLGRRPQYCRPPYGIFSKRYFPLLRELNQQLVLWSVMGYDFKWPASRVLSHLYRQTRPGDIVVLHDSPKAAGVVEVVLPEYIAWCREQGWEFAPIAGSVSG